MRLTIVKPDNTIRIDGRALTVDCSGLDPSINVVQWDADRGHIEFLNPLGASPVDYRGNQEIASLDAFQPVIDSWTKQAAVIDQPPTLDQVKAAKVVNLRMACAAAIHSGFQSDALGASHTYPMDETSQRNLAASVLASLLPSVSLDWTTPFWCADKSGAWSFSSHTASQIQKAGVDGKIAVVAAQTKLAGLMKDLAAATTSEAISALTW